MRKKPLPLTLLGDPVLRKKAEPVSHIQDPKVQRLIDQLITTVQAVHGVGIAAPQVGVSWRLFIVASKPNPRYPDAPDMEPLAMINPRLLSHGKSQTAGWEGCLSIPGLRGQVPRYTTLDVEYRTRYGERRRETLSGFIARIFQHEYDHINGMAYLDRVHNTRTFITEAEYRKQLKLSPSR